MYKQDLALNNLQGLICHKTQPTKFDLFCLCGRDFYILMSDAFPKIQPNKDEVWFKFRLPFLRLVVLPSLVCPTIYQQQLTCWTVTS